MRGQPDEVIICPSEPSFDDRLWSGTTLNDWLPVETKADTGEPRVFTHTGGATGPRRFWHVVRLEPAAP